MQSFSLLFLYCICQPKLSHLFPSYILFCFFSFVLNVSLFCFYLLSLYKHMQADGNPKNLGFFFTFGSSSHQFTLCYFIFHFFFHFLVKITNLNLKIKATNQNRNDIFLFDLTQTFSFLLILTKLWFDTETIYWSKI